MTPTCPRGSSRAQDVTQSSGYLQHPAGAQLLPMFQRPCAVLFLCGQAAPRTVPAPCPVFPDRSPASVAVPSIHGCVPLSPRRGGAETPRLPGRRGAISCSPRSVSQQRGDCHAVFKSDQAAQFQSTNPRPRKRSKRVALGGLGPRRSLGLLSRGDAHREQRGSLGRPEEARRRWGSRQTLTGAYHKGRRSCKTSLSQDGSEGVGLTGHAPATGSTQTGGRMRLASLGAWDSAVEALGCTPLPAQLTAAGAPARGLEEPPGQAAGHSGALDSPPPGRNCQKRPPDSPTVQAPSHLSKLLVTRTGDVFSPGSQSSSAPYQL